MPKLSKNSVAVSEQGPGREWADTLGGEDGCRIGFVETTADADLTPLLQGLPNDQCQCPHWGYVFKGSMWWRYGDREEVTEAGDAFYIPPGHTAGATANSEFIVFSPAKEGAALDAHIQRRAAELYGAAQLKG